MIKKLQTKLNCSYTFRFLISVILSAAFFSAVSGINLKCVFGTHTWPYIGEVKYCHSRELVVTSSNQSITSANDQPENHYHGENIKFLQILSQTVNFVPKRIEKVFLSIEGLQIDNSKLKTISKQDLEPFKELKIISMSFNDLETLDSDLFSFNPLLKRIHFQNNRLTFIGENVLEPLSNLERAHFNGNVCIKKDAVTPDEMEELKAEIKIKC